MNSRIEKPLINCKSLLVFLLVCIVSVSHGQVGVGTTSPDASAQLDVVSENKGFLTPRMTEAARTGISNPAVGLLVFQTDGDSGFWYYSASGWVKLATGKPAGTIIPYASGLPVNLSSVLGGVQTVSLVGFGHSVSGIGLPGPFIDLTGADGALLNFAFSVPRNGVITSLSAHFSNTAPLVLLGTVLTVKVEIFKAQEGTNLFVPLPGASAALAPGFTGLPTIGGVASTVMEGLSIPVIKGERLLLAFSITAEGMSPINNLMGYVSAGINIE